MDWTPTPVTSAALKPLTDNERQYLRKNEGCFRCRKVRAGHLAKDCPNGQVQIKATTTTPNIALATEEQMSENGEL